MTWLAGRSAATTAAASDSEAKAQAEATSRRSPAPALDPNFATPKDKIRRTNTLRRQMSKPIFAEVVDEETTAKKAKPVDAAETVTLNAEQDAQEKPKPRERTIKNVMKKKSKANKQKNNITSKSAATLDESKSSTGSKPHSQDEASKGATPTRRVRGKRNFEAKPADDQETAPQKQTAKPKAKAAASMQSKVEQTPTPVKKAKQDKKAQQVVGSLARSSTQDAKGLEVEPSTNFQARVAEMMKMVHEDPEVEEPAKKDESSGKKKRERTDEERANHARFMRFSRSLKSPCLIYL